MLFSKLTVVIDLPGCIITCGSLMNCDEMTAIGGVVQVEHPEEFYGCFNRNFPKKRGCLIHYC